MPSQRKRQCINNTEASNSTDLGTGTAVRPASIDEQESPRNVDSAEINGLPFPCHVLCQIFGNIPIVPQRVRLGAVCRQFRSAVLLTYHSVTEINLADFVHEFYYARSNQNLCSFEPKFGSNEYLQSILCKLVENFPNLESISGIRKVCLSPATPVFHVLAKFAKLKSISFTNCRINEGDLSEFLLNCPNLTHLNLSDAELLPPDSGPMSKKMGKNLNAGFRNLHKLENLNLHQLSTENEFEFLNDLNSPALKSVKLTDCVTLGKSYQNIISFLYRSLTSLQDIYVDSLCLCNVQFFRALANSSIKLRTLHICDNGYYDDIQPNPVALVELLKRPTCADLKALELSRFVFKDENLILSLAMVYLQKLEHLHLQVKLADCENLKSLKHLPNLQFLRINAAKSFILPIGVMSELSKSPNLQTLVFEWISITYEDLDHFADFAALRNLGLLAKNMFNEDFIKVCQIMGPRLEAICTAGSGVTNAGLSVLADQCPNLHTLENLDITIKAVSICKLADKCKKLRSIKIKGSMSLFEDFSNSDLLYLLANCDRLIELSLESKFLWRLWNDEQFQQSPFKYRVKLVNIMFVLDTVKSLFEEATRSSIFCMHSI